VWTFAAEPEAVRAARHVVQELAFVHGVAGEVADAMALCVTEAVTNAVVHAYHDTSEARAVELEAVRRDNGLCVYVRDAGSGLRPNSASTGLGLGLPLMAQLADQFEMRSASAGGTEVVLRFPLPTT
jgi:serine/threonine-protein kinase RsbW